MSDYTPAPAPPALPTPELIAKLRRLANAATPGPWIAQAQAYRHTNTGRCGVHWWITDANGYALPMDESASPHAKANAGLMTALDPATVLSLVAAAERLREVAEIAERFHQTTSSRYRPVEWLEAEARWLAVRDKVISKENDHA